MTDVALTETTHFDLALAEDLHRARDYVAASKAENTRRAYKSDWADFSAWCSGRGLVSMPAEPTTVALYLSANADVVKVSTLRRRLSSIAVAHRAVGHDSPTSKEPVTSVLAGIARTKGVAACGKAPVLVDDLRAMVGVLETTKAIGLRDRALLLLGFATGCRRSELVALNVDDVAFSAQGLTLTLRRSKTDQEGVGRKIGVPFGRSEATCPVRALKVWIERAGLIEGALFRAVNKAGVVSKARLTAQVVRLIVLRTAKAAGIDASNLGAHSLRSGLVTSAVIGGASEIAIMRQTGHASVAMVRRYTRDADLFRGNVVNAVGL
jgi:site-specific recombinase XerD